jgi:hypothetical protein
MWGIGRYLYDIDGVWVEIEQRGNGKGYFVKNNQMDKLKVAYETALKRIFGVGATQQPPTPAPPMQQNQSDTKPTPVPQNNNTKQQPNVPQPPTSTQQQHVAPPSPSAFDFKVQSMKSSGKGSQLLELCNHEGKIKSAYVKSGEKGIAVGAYLRNVKFEQKTSAYGKYNLITRYELVA